MRARSLNAGQVWCYFAKSGWGKTRLALYHLRPFSRVLIHDPNGEAQHAARAIVCDDPEHLVRLIARPGPVRICWRGIKSMGADAFEWANRGAIAGEGFAIFWDEVDKFVRNRPLPPYAYQLANSGRHWGCRVFFAARRPANVGRDLTAAATRICAGLISDPESVAYLRDFMGDPAKQLPTLAAGQFVDWQGGPASVKKIFFP